MTATATDIDLEQLFDQSPVCEFLQRHGNEWIQCAFRADWLIRIDASDCAHDVVDCVLACELCLRKILDDKLLKCSARDCGMDVCIRQVIKL